MYCNVPVNVSVLGHRPANLFDVPKSEIFTTPLYVFTSTLSPTNQCLNLKNMAHNAHLWYSTANQKKFYMQIPPMELVTSSCISEWRFSWQCHTVCFTEINVLRTQPLSPSGKKAHLPEDGSMYHIPRKP